MRNNLTEVALDVLDKYKGTQMNLDSEAARKIIAEDFADKATDWIRNLWKEDFEKPNK